MRRIQHEYRSLVDDSLAQVFCLDLLARVTSARVEVALPEFMVLNAEGTISDQHVNVSCWAQENHLSPAFPDIRELRCTLEHFFHERLDGFVIELQDGRLEVA